MATKKGETEILRKATEHLACKLTDDELRAKGQQLAATLDDIKAEESRHDALKTQMKSAMAALESRRDTLSLHVSRREEHRDVEVEDTADYRSAKFSRTRLDTGEVIFERPLTNEERQVPLPIGS